MTPAGYCRWSLRRPVQAAVGHAARLGVGGNWRRTAIVPVSDGRGRYGRGVAPGERDVELGAGANVAGTLETAAAFRGTTDAQAD